MKKLLLVFVVLAAIGAGLYFYAYQGHRDIASEAADEEVTVAALSKAFGADPQAASARYADKTLLVQGVVTAVDPLTRTVTLDGLLTASFEALPSVGANDRVTIKARFVGYDDLLGEFRTDQASLVH